MTRSNLNDIASPRLARVEAQLFTTDVVASTTFYRDKLGFRIVFVYGDPPHYAQVARDGVALNLRQLDTPAIEPERRDREQLLAASVTVATADDLSALFRAFDATGVRFNQRLETKPWGATDFIVADPDGNLLLFAGPIA